MLEVNIRSNCSTCSFRTTPFHQYYLSNMGRFILIAGLCLVVASVASAYDVMCYVNIEAQNRPASWNFDPATNIDPTLCTHLVIGYADIGSANDLVEKTTGDSAFYSAAVAHKSTNTDLKVFLAVGGPDFDTSKFTGLDSDANRAAFAASALSFLRSHSLDGLILDWRYPEDTEKDAFTALCQELSEEFDNEVTTNPLLKLGAAVSAERADMESIYDIPELDKHLDSIHVMAYDFHDHNDGFAKHHAPLKGYANKNAEDAMILWRNKGASRSKLLLGVSAYGRSYTLANPQNHNLGDEISGAGSAGAFTGQAGVLSYFEICSAGFTRVWSDFYKVPYSYGGGQWVTYDDDASAVEKATHVINYSFGGVALWSLDLDDYTGSCPQGGAILNSLVSTLTADVPTITITTSQETGRICPTEDLYIGCLGRENTGYNVPGYPSCYYNCWDDMSYMQQCPHNKVFFENCNCCNYDDSLHIETGGTGANFCENRGDGFYAKEDDNTQYYQCSHGITHVMTCATNLVYKDSCTCCDHNN